MHLLLSPAGEVVLSPGVALKIVTPEVSQNIFRVSPPYDICVGAQTQTNKPEYNQN
jgi:hypothetical protein